MWNGTAETLKAKPTSSRTIASTIITPGFTDAPATRIPSSSSLVVPATAYANAIP